MSDFNKNTIDQTSRFLLLISPFRKKLDKATDLFKVAARTGKGKTSTSGQAGGKQPEDRLSPKTVPIGWLYVSSKASGPLETSAWSSIPTTSSAEVSLSLQQGELPKRSLVLFIGRSDQKYRLGFKTGSDEISVPQGADGGYSSAFEAAQAFISAAGLSKYEANMYGHILPITGEKKKEKGKPDTNWNTLISNPSLVRNACKAYINYMRLMDLPDVSSVSKLREIAEKINKNKGESDSLVDAFNQISSDKSVKKVFNLVSAKKDKYVDALGVVAELISSDSGPAISVIKKLEEKIKTPEDDKRAKDKIDNTIMNLRLAVKSGKKTEIKKALNAVRYQIQFFLVAYDQYPFQAFVVDYDKAISIIKTYRTSKYDDSLQEGSNLEGKPAQSSESKTTGEVEEGENKEEVKKKLQEDVVSDIVYDFLKLEPKDLIDALEFVSGFPYYSKKFKSNVGKIRDILEGKALWDEVSEEEKSNVIKLLEEGLKE